MKGAQFHYRVNADGTIDSICLRCYLTAAKAEKEADLHELEAAHRCPNKNEFSTLKGTFRGYGGKRLIFTAMPSSALRRWGMKIGGSPSISSSSRDLALPGNA
jgi:hypothetical protein